MRGPSLTAGLPEQLRLVTWNAEWAPTKKRAAIRARIASLDPDVIVLTEGDAGVLPDGGHSIDAGTEWGYVSPDPARRKVILWSRFPPSDVDTVGSRKEEMPGGRWVAGTVETTRGPIRIMGVCIPWKDAHVRSGRRDADSWDEHLAYLRCMSPVFHDAAAAGNACVLGDFNQRIPRRGAGVDVHEALLTALGGFRVVTEGAVDGLVDPPVDHIAIGSRLGAHEVRGVDRHEDGPGLGRELSDHHLVSCVVSVGTP